MDCQHLAEQCCSAVGEQVGAGYTPGLSLATFEHLSAKKDPATTDLNVEALQLLYPASRYLQDCLLLAHI